MSRTFGANSGSVLSLKDSTRCGCSLCFFQIRCTVAAANLLTRRHAPNTPMRRILWGSLHRSLDNHCFFRRGDLLGAATTVPVLDDSGQSVAFMAPPPQQNRRQRG